MLENMQDKLLVTKKYNAFLYAVNMKTLSR